MTGKTTDAPLYEPIADSEGIASPAWTLFFNRLFQGDVGTDWTPSFVGLGTTGEPTITGKYYRLSRNIVYYRVNIIPATNTSSVAGTTYIENFPLDMRADGACVSLAPSSGVGGGIGVSAAASGRIFTPVWTDVTIPVIIVGMMEAQ
jgi:hypothetical protein